MKLHAVAFVALAAFAFPAVAGAGKVYLEDSMPKVSSTQVTIKVRKPAAFKVLMRPRPRGGRSCSCSASMLPRAAR